MTSTPLRKRNPTIEDFCFPDGLPTADDLPCSDHKPGSWQGGGLIRWRSLRLALTGLGIIERKSLSRSREPLPQEKLTLISR